MHEKSTRISLLDKQSAEAGSLKGKPQMVLPFNTYASLRLKASEQTQDVKHCKIRSKT